MRDPVIDPYDQPTEMIRYYGLYKGKVELRAEHEQLGRLRVRVVGIHDDLIPAEQLPWASPNTPAWGKGGIFGIPPIGEYVWIQFEAGYAEYPVWSGGWWASDSNGRQTPDGTGQAKNITWPTVGCGGTRINGGDLAMEGLSGVEASDQPNNFIFRSVLQKHVELDDRQTISKVKLSDQLDNYLWINTEHGIITVEASRGLQGDATVGKYRGLTLNSKDEVIQLYSFKNWKLTISDRDQFAELSGPNGNKLRIDEKRRVVELWTHDGNTLVLSDADESAILKTKSGDHVILKDGQFAQIQCGSSIIDMKTSGDITVVGGASINLVAPVITLTGAVTTNDPSDSISLTSDFVTPYPVANAVKAERAPDASPPGQGPNALRQSIGTPSTRISQSSKSGITPAAGKCLSGNTYGRMTNFYSAYTDGSGNFVQDPSHDSNSDRGIAATTATDENHNPLPDAKLLQYAYTNDNGVPVVAGSASVNPDVIPYGSTIVVKQTMPDGSVNTQLYVAADTGGGDLSSGNAGATPHVDFYAKPAGDNPANDAFPLHGNFDVIPYSGETPYANLTGPQQQAVYDNAVTQYNASQAVVSK